MPPTIEHNPVRLPASIENRFRVERVVGSGGMGIVYQVYDLVRVERVALKVLQEVSPNALFRLKREFRFLAQTRHPNLVTLYEFFHADGAACFTMELLRGVDLLRWLHSPNQPRTGGHGGYGGNRKRLLAGLRTPANATSPEGLGYVRRSFAQLAEGLSAVHASGHLHRDIKPDNVLATAEGRIVLLDFGLVTQGAEDRSVSLVGTPLYMAPEQLSGRVTPATDWYAFGVVLYEVLTGEPPFASEPDWVRLLNKKVAERPRRPRDLNRMVPDDLNALCLDLLEGNPARRPAAAEVIERLAARSDSAPVHSVVRSPLFGRVEELAALATAVDDCAGGSSQIVGLFGAAGMGKSALLQEAGERAADRALVLRGRCFETLSTPYNGIDCFMDDVVDAARGLGEPALTFALGTSPQLPQIFPVLGRVECLAPSTGRDRQLDRARLTDELARLLACLCEGRPLVICVDDAQNIDDDSLEFLMDLLASRVMPPVALILAAPAPTEMFRELAQQAERCRGTVHEIHVGPLRRPHALACAAWLVGQRGSRLRSEKLDTLVDQSSAVPRLLEELARGVRTVVDDEGMSTSEVPELHALLRTRVSGLEVGAQRLLEVLAVAHAPLKETELAAAAGLEFCDPHLRDLTVEGLASVRRASDERVVDVLNPSLRVAVMEGVSRERVRELHGAMARALEPAAERPELLAEHYRLGGTPERGRALLVTAADAAVTACAWTRAVQLYERAVEVGADRPEILEKWAISLLGAGRVDQGARLLLDLARTEPRATALPLLHTAASALLLCGENESGAEVLDKILAGTGIGVPSSSLLAAPADLWRRALLTWRLRRSGSDEKRGAPVSTFHREQMEACWTVTTTMAMARPMVAAAFHTRFLLLALDHGDAEHLALGYALESSLRASLGLANANRYLARAHRLATEAKSAHALGVVASVEATRFLYDGEFVRCLDACGRARTHLQPIPTKAAWQLHSLLIQELASCFYLGDLNGLSVHVSGGRSGIEVPKTPYANALLSTGFATVALLAADRPDTARRELRIATEGWLHGDEYVQGFQVLVAETHRLAYEGRHRDAFVRFEAAWSKVAYRKFLAVPFVGPALRSLRAMTAAAALPHFGERAARIVRREARRLAKMPVRWGRVLGSASLAAVAAFEGRSTDAHELLLQVERGAQGCGLKLHAAAARLRRAELLNDAAGEAEEVVAFAQEGVLKPHAMARLFCPAFTPPRRLLSAR